MNEQDFHWLYLAPVDFYPEKLPDRFPTPKDKTVTVHLDGRLIANSESLLAAISKAMHFPSYFGHNWSALEDCLGDLEWLPAEVYNVVWQEGSHLLLSAPADFFMFLDVCSVAARWWIQQGIILRLWIADDYLLKTAEYWKSAVVIQL